MLKILQRHVEVMMHYDNTPAHNTYATQSSVENAEFQCMKHLLEGTERLTREQLRMQIEQILREIPGRIWKATFLNWMERLHSFIELWREYAKN
ncbi:MAG: hypothetical protein EZS28_009716 [Streblomastix strix]|uniref:Uncharacterized protein n=1 Tax=Streblomastix strix TaxID=222440 RepID=A0A5J4WJ45_9EUKA|nr:MAG: hypothetical protein EZS28_009716 [Streblomastix strix]